MSLNFLDALTLDSHLIPLDPGHSGVSATEHFLDVLGFES